jgi:ribonuclease HI
MDVKIYTDGAARGNPDGPGGYGTVIQFIDGKGTLHEREFSHHGQNYEVWAQITCGGKEKKIEIFTGL